MWTCALVAMIVFSADADIIYFKDGMKTICQEKAWEENEEVKCEYGGWVLSYQKSEVLRIVKTTPDKPTAPQKSKGQMVKNEPKIKTQNKPKETKPQKEGDSKNIKKPEGIAFYDPRRPFKYWSGPTSKHKTYREAVEALAKKYQKSPDWIQTHMGDTNDLEELHKNLANPKITVEISAEQPSQTESSGIEFYNPRRKNPYWTDESSQHKTFQDAIDTLAKKYDRSPTWVKENMGTSNDLNAIHQNLANPNSAESMTNPDSGRDEAESQPLHKTKTKSEPQPATSPSAVSSGSNGSAESNIE